MNISNKPLGRARYNPATWLALGAISLLFLVLGWPFARRLGIEVDEAIVGNGIYPGISAHYSWWLFGNEIPVMLLSYMGTLKTWIDNAVFAVFKPGQFSLRLPMMLAGVAALWLFFRFVDRVAGRPAAWIATLLLATDTSFLLSDTIDMGGVALQPLFKLGAILLILRFHETNSLRALAGAFFLLGLGLWDKAVFVWVLGGLGVATIAIFPRELLQHLRPKTVAIAAGAFLVGAFPLISYNIAYPLETFHSNVHVSLDDRAVKLDVLQNTFNGRVNLYFLTAPAPGPSPGQPHRLMQRVAFALNDLFGQPITNWTISAYLVSLLALPLVWQAVPRRAILFAILFQLVTWIAMFVTNGAGSGAHHIILLWPFHFLVIAAVLLALAARLRRFGPAFLIAATLLLCGRNMLVTNRYYVELVRNGTSVRWTDAFGPLIEYLKENKDREVLALDWGIVETINLMTEGEVDAHDENVAVLSVDRDPRIRQWLEDKIGNQNILWLAHVSGHEVRLGVAAKLDQVAGERGFHAERAKIILDRNGRAIFVVFRYRRNS